MAKRYAGNSEYGGGDGDPQRYPAGGSLDLPGIASAAGVRARIMRQVGMADFDVEASDVVGLAATGIPLGNLSAAQREAYEADLVISAGRAAERARLMAATNGYAAEPEQYVGDDASGGAGVETSEAEQSADPEAFGGQGDASGGVA